MKDQSQPGQSEPDKPKPASPETRDGGGQAGSQGETDSSGSPAPSLVEKIFFALAATAVGVFTTTFALVVRPKRFVGLVKGEASLGKHHELGAAAHFLGSMIFFFLGLYYVATAKVSTGYFGEHPFLGFLEKPLEVLISGNFNSIVMNLLPAIALVIVMAVGLRVALWILRGGGTFDMAMRASFYATGVWLSLWGIASFLFGVFGVPESFGFVDPYSDELSINWEGILFYSVVLVGPVAFFRVLFSLTRHSFDVGRWRGLGALPLAAILWAGISISGYFAGKPFFDVREETAAAEAAKKAIEEREAALLAVARPAVPSPGKPGEPQTSDDEDSTEWPFHGYTNSIGLEMLWCRPDTFTMGSPEEETQHEVKLTRGFWLGRFEVTQAEWTEVMAINPSKNQLNPRYPVTNVTWYDAKSFCTRLTEREKAAGRLPDGWNYDLPTEAQWEYACRAGTETPFSFGSVLDGNQANCNGNFPYGTESKGPLVNRTTAVGVFPANPWGFHDMHGNVWEWCLDWYGEYEPGPDDQPVVDPSGPASGAGRVYRGGGWSSEAEICRSAIRNWYFPDDAFFLLGIRVALSSKPGPVGPAQPGTANPEQAKGGSAASEAAPTKPGD